jgi:hypothetical protein
MTSRLRGIFFRLIILTALAATAIAIPVTVSSQTSITAVLSAPDTQAFPTIQAYLVVKDEAGNFVHGLEPADVSAIEDGQTLPVSSLSEVRPGIQFVVAINPAPPFALRDSRGVTRSSAIQRALAAWGLSRQGSTLDDLSLLTTDGAETTHLKDTQKFVEALNLEEIDPRQATPSLDTLLRAVEIASDNLPRPGMGRAVLFITPPMEDQTEVASQNVIARAKELGISIFIWAIPVPGAYYPNAEKQFQQLTGETGGKLFTFSDEQPLPDPEEILEPFRSAYQLTYSSQIRSSGAHQLAADVKIAAGTVTTPVQTFEVNIQPPEPAFVSPPLDIKRGPPPGESQAASLDIPLTEYLPTEQEIQVLVSFPDERQRPLIRTSLFVDGQLIQENRQAPFDRFSWNVSDYTASGPHMLRVEAEDNLGLVGTSIERMVQITLEQPAATPWSWVFRNAPALSVLGAVVAGSILLLVLLLGGRLRPRQPGMAKTGRRKSDPVTQPVSVRTEAPARRASGWTNRIHWPQRAIPPQAYAFLTRIADSDHEGSSTPVPLIADEITLGSAPNRATLVLNDPSIDDLHARIIRQPDGSYRLNDEGSIAGTWINYTPISREGAPLEHGDLIHIGRIGFRFTTRQSSQVRKAVVTPAESPQENGA